MNAQELAAALHGREYGDEITQAEEAAAKAAGLVVVFGASDDLLEFRGAIHDEIGANDGTTARVTAEGPLKDWESVDHDDEDAAADYFRRKALPGVDIVATWAPKDEPTLSWRISTTPPHATFDVMEDGETFCRGIVFALADIAPGAAS